MEVEGYEAVSISYPRFERDLPLARDRLEGALEQDHVEPLAVELPVADVGADGAEAGALEQLQARLVAAKTFAVSLCRPRSRVASTSAPSSGAPRPCPRASLAM